MMDKQLIVVIVILAIAIGYVVWRIQLAIKRSNDPCQGCAGCALKEQLQKNGHIGRKNEPTQLKEHQKTGCYHKK